MSRVLALVLFWTSVQVTGVGARPAPPRPRLRVVYPRLVKSIKAPYPAAAFKAGRQGVVRLHVTVGVDGRVQAVQVIRSAGKDLDAAAIWAVKQFVYRPARVDGKAIAAKIVVAYPFTLKKSPPPRRPAARRIPPRRPPSKKRPPPRPRARRRPPPPKRPGAPGGVLKGRVREKGTRKFLEDAEVLIYRPIRQGKGLGRKVASRYSNAKGRFRIRGLPPGQYRVVVRAPGCRPFQVTEKLAAGLELVVEYFVLRRSYDPYETVVTVRAERKEVSRHLVALPEVQRIPGTGGDALRAIQNMPGVARAPFAAGLLVVRGTSPEATRVFLNGHEIPQLYHFGGLTSIFNSDILREIVFLPGNFSVRYGRVGGAVIDVLTRSPKRDRWQGYVDIDIWDGGFLVEGPVGKGSIAIAARRSWIDAIFAAMPKGTFGNFTLAPAYYDYQVLFEYPILGGRFKTVAFGSDDRMKLLSESPSSGSDVANQVKLVIFFHRAIAAWKRKWKKHTLALSLSGGFQRQDNYFGPVSRIKLDTARFDWRAHYEHRLTKKATLAIGHVGEVAYWWVDLVISRPGGEGEVWRPSTSEETMGLQLKEPTTNQAVYAELTWKPLPRWTLIPGVRAEWVRFRGLERTIVDPRFTTKLDLIKKRLVLTAAVGLYSHQPGPVDILPEIGGNPHVNHERVLQSAVGVWWKIRDSLTLEVTGFYKHSWDRIVSSGRVVWRDGEPAREGRANLGYSRIYGGELMLRKQADRDCPGWLKLQKCFGWLSYTLLRSERQDGPGEEWRLFDWDQTHILTLVLSGAWEGGWEFGIRFRLASGNPYTPLTGGLFDSDTDQYFPTYGALNSARMPLFHQLDLRVDKRFVFQRWMLAIYLDIQNVYYYQAKEFIIYNHNYTQTGWVRGLPIVPSLGLKASF